MTNMKKDQNMRITLTQPEIEEAILKHLLSQMTVNDGMSIKIDLSATRGAEGFTANIDITPQSDVEEVAQDDAVLDISNKVKAAKTTKAIKTEPAPEKPSPAKEPEKEKATETAVAEPEVPETTDAEAPAEDGPADTVETEEAGEDEVPVKKGPSLFANLKKPVNTKTE